MNALQKILVVLCSLLIASPSFSGSSLTIATINDNPPFEMQVNQSGEFWGFEIALMKEICKRIQSDCTFKSSLFLDVGNMVNEGQADLAIAAIVITPERRKKFLFSEPYKESHVQYLVKNTSKIKTIAQLRGKKVAIYLDSPSRAFVLNQFNHDIELTAFSNSMDMLNALTKNKVEALVTNQGQALYWASNDSSYRLLGPKFPLGDGYGIMTRLGRDFLIQQINRALLEMEKDGTYLKIYTQSF